MQTRRFVLRRFQRRLRHPRGFLAPFPLGFHDLQSVLQLRDLVELAGFCDLLLPGPLPCFYTLVFPAAALGAALISQSLLPAGFLCAAAGSLLAFLLTDLLHCLLLWLRGQAAWSAGAWVFLRELCVSLPLLIPVVLLFSAVFRRTHLDD